MRRLIVAASLLALAATACQIETNSGVVINADGSGLIVAEVGMDEAARSMLGDQVGDPFEDNDLSQVPNAVQRTETRGDFMFWILEIPVDDVTQIEDDVVGADNSLLTSLDVQVTETLVSVSASATASDAMGEEFEGIDPTLLEDALTFNVRITMPGRITDHNADDRDGNTLIWRIPLFGAGGLDVQAQSDPSQAPTGGGDGIPVWVWIVIAAVVIGGGLYWYMQQQKTRDSSPANAVMSTDTEPPAPPPAE